MEEEEVGNDNNDGTTVSNVFDAVYVNHGFGALALSWLPAMPKLARAFGGSSAAALVLGHDAPGFGFTDRLEEDDNDGDDGDLRA